MKNKIPGELKLSLTILLCSVSVLLFEMLQVRVFAYSLTPILAYAAISLSMTGFGMGAMLLSLWPSLGRRDVTRTLSVLGMLQAVAMVFSCLLLARVSSAILASFQENIVPLVFEILIPSILPHFFMGLFVAVVFSAASAKIGKIYFFNLLGSGLGCIAIVTLMLPLGAEQLIIISALLSVGASFLLAVPGRKALIGSSAVMLIVGLALLPIGERLFPFKPDPIDTIGLSFAVAKSKGQKAPYKQFSEWNIVGKVEVWNNEAETVRIPDELQFRVLSVDSGGTTQLIQNGPPGFGKFLFEESVYGIGYGVKPSAEKVLIIGCGGGMDVQSALHWNAKNITCIEINKSTIRAVEGTFGSFLEWPKMTDRVNLRLDDGRSFVKGTSERFDLIQMSGVDTITVYATGSINMNEDSLYTVDAFEDYMSALKPDGIYVVTRVGKDYIRLTAIATEALLRLGQKTPGRNIVAFKQGGASGVVVKRTPFTKRDLDGLTKFASRKYRLPNVSIPHFDLYRLNTASTIELVYVPGRDVKPSFARYFAMARLAPQNLAKIYEKFSISVPTDDNPYYMLGQLMAAKNHPGKFKESLEMMTTFWQYIVIIALVFIILPVVVLRRKSVSALPMMWVLPYFFGIGFCFMLVEICIIHLFTIFVGSPGASLAIVLTGILVASGIGSYITERVGLNPLSKIVIATLVLVASAVFILTSSESIFDAVWSSGASPVTRGVITVLMIAPMGLAMGWFFPSGLKSLEYYFKGNDLIPWAVSINGFASVLGSVLVLHFSMVYGFRVVFITAICGYILIALVSGAFFFKKKMA